MRARSFLLGNLAVLLALALLAGVYVLWQRDPARVDRELPLFLPAELVRGQAGEAVRAGPLAVTVEPLERVASVPAAEGLRLGTRARPGRTTDYVSVRLVVRNDGGRAFSFDYYGMGQRAELWLGARRPSPRATAPVTPREAEALTGRAALPAGPLPPGGSLEGVVVFAVSRAAEELSVLVLPAMLPSGERAEDGPPAVEVTLPF